MAIEVESANCACSRTTSSAASSRARDNNIRLTWRVNTLHKVVAQDPQAVQRHRNTIVDSLEGTTRHAVGARARSPVATAC